jgi:hypothetical protein
VNALLLADHIYRDAGTGKFVIAGTFHDMHVERCPTTFGRSVGLFVSLSGVERELQLGVEVLGPEREVLLTRAPVRVPGGDALDLGLELPPLPLPRPGRYVVRVTGDGVPLSELELTVSERA